MTNEELLNMFAGQAMQALLQKYGLAADKERICKTLGFCYWRSQGS